MTFDRMSASKLKRQNHSFVLGEIVLGKLHLPIKNRDQVLGFKLLRLWTIRSVAFQAKRICLCGAQQMVVIPAMRFVADRARLSKNRLVQMGFLELIRLL